MKINNWKLSETPPAGWVQITTSQSAPRGYQVWWNKKPFYKKTPRGYVKGDFQTVLVEIEKEQ